MLLNKDRCMNVKGPMRDVAKKSYLLFFAEPKNT
jgi:hypothetical protein